MKPLLLLVALALNTCASPAQSPLMGYPEAFRQQVATLDEGDPFEFYTAAAEHFREGRLPEAGFLAYVAQMRLRYYLATHPDEPEDGANALFTSLHHTVGAEINAALQEDTAQFLRVLDAAIAYCEGEGGGFFPRVYDPEQYDRLLDGLRGFRANVAEPNDD